MAWVIFCGGNGRGGNGARGVGFGGEVMMKRVCGHPEHHVRYIFKVVLCDCLVGKLHVFKYPFH
jgi:hypothetical protein